jgi:ABC-type multidrug transport system fused ATPase/permease subunit
VTATATPRPRRQQIGWLLDGYFRPEAALAVLLLLVVLLVSGLELVMPLLAGGFIDAALGGEQLSGLRRLAFGFLAAALAFAVFRVVQFYLAERLAMNATNRLRTDLTSHCLGLDAAFHNRYRPGELVERIEGDVAALGRFLSTLLVTLVGNGLLLVGILVTLFVVDWRLGLLMTAFVVLICLVLNAMRGRATPMWAEALQAEADQSGFLTEQFAAREDIRSSGAVPYALRGFTVHARTVLARSLTASRRTAALDQVTSLLFRIALAAGLGLAAWLVLYHGATVATVYLVYRYADLLSYPIYRINYQLSDLQRATAAVGRIEELFNYKSALADGRGLRPAAGAPTVELDAVTYGYDSTRPVLHDVSLVVPAGGRLGVVGRTGAGKTTIARLLLRLADPDVGAVRIGGVDLRDMIAADVRHRVGLVTQDVQIMNTTLRDNLTLFDRTVSDERIVAALTEIGIDGLLTSLPAGLDTVLASGGGGLSAGEAQLVGLARVFLRNPQVVVLDEATSRLDVATERMIDRAVDRLLKGRTAVVIAHRLSTVERADQIVLMDGGRVVEAGDRALLAADPDSRFAALLRMGLERVGA